jgi:hypothetical protein
MAALILPVATTDPAPPAGGMDAIPAQVWFAGAIALWVLFAWMVGRQAKMKGQSFWRFFIASFFFSPFALSLALHMMRKPASRRPQ